MKTNIAFAILLTMFNYGFAFTLLLCPIILVGYNLVKLLDKYSYQDFHA